MSHVMIKKIARNYSVKLKEYKILKSTEWTTATFEHTILTNNKIYINSGFIWSLSFKQLETESYMINKGFLVLYKEKIMWIYCKMR